LQGCELFAELLDFVGRRCTCAGASAVLEDIVEAVEKGILLEDWLEVLVVLKGRFG
jgi:hypothetical protein